MSVRRMQSMRADAPAAKKSRRRWVTALIAVLTTLASALYAPPALAAPGDLGVTVSWVDTSNADVSELAGTVESETDLQARLVGVQVGYSCGPTACAEVVVKIDAMPLDPYYAALRFASLNSMTLPAGATRTGNDASGYTISLGALPAGSSGSFLALYTYQTRGTAPAPQSFFPDGQVITASATITGTGLTSATATDDVTWRIETPEPGVSFFNQGTSTTTLNQATADSNYTYTDYQTVGCQWIDGGHGEPRYECAAEYTVTQTFPAGVEFVSASDGGVFESATNTVTWSASGLSAASGWGLLTGAGTPRTVTVRYPSSMISDPDQCVIDISTILSTDVTYLSGAEKSASTSTTHKLNGCTPFGAGRSEKFSSVSVTDPTTSIVWAGSTQQWTVRAYNTSNVTAVGIINDTFDQADLPVTRIQSPNGPAVIHATLDNAQIVDITSADWTAPAGRTVASVRIETPSIAGPNTSESDQSGANFAPIRFFYTVTPTVPSGGFTRTNTASVSLTFPDNPSLGTIDVGTKSATVLVTRRPAQLRPTITATVPGGGNPVAGQNVTFAVSGVTSDQEAGVAFQPQYVFAAPFGWTIAPGSAAIPGLPDAAFEYRTVTIGGRSRQIVVAHRPSGTVWGVNSTWPAMTVQASPNASLPANTVSTATFYQGDAAHTYGPRDAIWGAPNNSAFGDFRYDDAADLDGDGSTGESFAYAATTIRIGSASGLNVVKEICQPTASAPDGCTWLSDSATPVAVSPETTGIKYRVTLTNGGNTALSGVVAYDVLPYPGDTGLTAGSTSTSRGSTFAEHLDSVSAVSGVTLQYSMSQNPCRAEVYPAAPGCTSDWGSTVADARAIKSTVPGTLAAGASVSFVYLADVVGAPGADALACNSVAIASATTPATEPPAVCAVVQSTDLAVSAPTTLDVQTGRPATVPLTFRHLAGTTTPATVTLELSNGVSVTDLTPAGWTCTVAEGGVPVDGPATLTCETSTVFSEGTTGELGLPVIVSDAAATVEASIGSDIYDGVPANNRTTVAFVVSPAAAGLGLTKTDSRRTVLPGNEVTYSLTLTNPFDFEDLGEITLTDTLPEGQTFVSASDGGTANGQVVTWALSGLSAQQSRTVTVTATVDDDAPGQLTNTAKASAVDPVFGDPLTGEAEDTDDVTRATLTKTAALPSDGPPTAGDIVTFTFVLTNTGGGSLSDAVIEDDFPGLGAITYDWPTADRVLAAGEGVTATATYELTQADIDAGALSNAATASAADVDAREVAATASVDVPLPKAPAIELAKTATGDLQKAGDVVTFTLVARNTGNVSLTDVTFDDPFTGLSALDIDWPGAEGTLSPGATTTAVATYTLVQSDVDAGSIKNTATVSGIDPDAASVAAVADTTIGVPAIGMLTLDKAGALETGATGVAGTPITWTFTVSNEGPTTISGIQITDSFAGLSEITWGDWPAAAGTLAPGETVTATATSELTATEIADGYVQNTAVVAGAQLSGLELTNEDSARVTIPPASPIDTIVGGLAQTGGVVPVTMLLAAAGLLGGGIVLLLRRRQRSAE